MNRQLILLVVCLSAAAWAAPRPRTPPSGRPLNDKVVDLARNKGPSAHDKDGKIKVPHGSHKPLETHHYPKKQLTVYHQHEIPKSSVNPNFANHYGCDYSINGHWDTATTEPIRFFVNPTGSGLSEDAIIHAFDTAASIIYHDASLALRRPLLFEHLPMGSPYTPSLHKPANVTRQADQVNHIGFGPRAASQHLQAIVAEVYVLKDRDTSEILESDIVLANDPGMEWCNEKIVNTRDPNHWSHRHDLGFDLVSTAVWALGHALGLGPTDAHTHTMHAGTARGAFHKRSMECGDVNGLRAIYGRLTTPPPTPPAPAPARATVASAVAASRAM